MVKLLLFDMQGTVIENGIYPSPIKQVKFLLGIRQGFHDYVPEFEKVFMIKNFDTLTQAFHAVAEHFNVSVPEFQMEKLVGVWNKNKLLSKPFPESFEVLKDLKNDYKLALLANLDSFSKDIVQKYSLGDYFDNIYLSCDTGMLKSDTGLFDKIVSDTGIAREDMLMIGDSVESDMKSAENAGILSVLLDRRNRMVYEPKIASLTELKRHLAKLD